MPLLCPACGSDRFKILDALEMGRSPPWDERTVQRARCPVCRKKFICIYREERVMSDTRPDKVEHMAYENQSWIWVLGALVFQKPSRKLSPEWRRNILRRHMLIRCVGDTSNPEMELIYRKP